MFYGIWLVVLGALAVPSLVLGKKPELKSTLDKITPYQGWIGALSAVWGVWGMIHAILNINWLAHAPIWWSTYAANNTITFALGMLLGVGTLKTFIKDGRARVKMDQLITKLAPHQGRLGIAALGVGAWCIVASFVFA